MDELLLSTHPPASNANLMPASVSNQLHASGIASAGSFQSPAMTSVWPQSTASQLTSVPLQQPTHQPMFTSVSSSSLVQNAASPRQPIPVSSSTDAAGKLDFQFSSELLLSLMPT